MSEKKLRLTEDAQEFISRLESWAPDLDKRFPFLSRPAYFTTVSGHQFSLHKRGAGFNVVEGDLENLPEGGSLLTLRSSFDWPDALTKLLLTGVASPAAIAFLLLFGPISVYRWNSVPPSTTPHWATYSRTIF